MTPHLTLPAALSAEDCRRLIALVQTQHLKDAGLVGGTAAPELRRAAIAWLDDIPAAAWAMDQMIAHVARANRETFGFDITDFGESAQIARYDAARADHFDWHADIGRGPQAARRKLTIVVQLSDPASYAGGTLELRPDSSIVTAQPALGTATLFPSFVLHRVTPLTAGTRWSLTLWAHGPAFR